MAQRRRAAKKSARRGQMLIMLSVMGLIMVLSVVATNVALIKQDMRHTVLVGQMTSAFHAAEAGLDRGTWKMQESDDVWDDITDLVAVPGYDGNTEYTDEMGNFYRIRFSSGPDSGQVTITAAGRDKSTHEVRRLQAVFDRPGVKGAIQAPLITQGGSAKIHWGKIMSTGYLTLSGAADVLYPRKYARSYIDPRDTTNDGNNTDNLEYWAYSSEVPDIPTPKFSDFLRDATCNAAPPANFTFTAGKGSYYEGSGTKSNSNCDNTTFTTYYLKSSGGSLTYKFQANTHFEGILIAEGDVTITFAGNSVNTHPFWFTPPADAYLEYQKDTPAGAGADSIAADEYPGDSAEHTVESYCIGAHKVAGNNTGGCATHNELGGANGDPPQFKGFLYSAGDVGTTGNCTVHGAIMVGGGGDLGSGNWELFYDPDIVVAFESGTVTRASWNELSPQWPP